MRRGKEGGCQACVLEEQRRQLHEQRRLAALKDEQAAQQLKKEIKEKAKQLRNSELQVLRKRWLSRAEFYFELDSKQFEDAVAETVPPAWGYADAMFK